jgi:outer membrane biosynthesis protein TonB
VKCFLRSGACVISTVLGTSGIIVAQSPKQIPQPSSAGATIEAAAKGAAQDREKNRDAQGQEKTGQIEILSDTQGVDFGPYLQDAIARIRRKWYSLIPPGAQHQKGRLAIECKVHKDGRISDLKLTNGAGSELDGPAWGSIMAASPLPALPEAYHRNYLALRFRFFYNPDKSDLKEMSHGVRPPL